MRIGMLSLLLMSAAGQAWASGASIPMGPEKPSYLNEKIPPPVPPGMKIEEYTGGPDNTPFVATAPVAKLRYEWTDLSLLRKVVHAPSPGGSYADHLSPYSYDSYGSVLIRRAMHLDESLRSWMFLMDGSATNPLVSDEMRKFRDGDDACLNRVLFTEIDHALQEFKDDVKPTPAIESDLEFQRLMLAQILKGENFDIDKWRSESGAFKNHLRGTRSQGAVNLFLTMRYEALKDLLNSDRADKLIDESLSCNAEVNLVKLFPWADLQQLQELLVQEPTEEGLMRQLDSLISTSFVPDFAPVIQEQMNRIDKEIADAKQTMFPLLPLEIQDKKRITPIGAEEFALRPSFGGLLNEKALPKKFYRALMKLVFQRAYNAKGYLTADTCKATNQVLFWANALGIRMAGTPDVQFREGIDRGMFEQAVQLLLGDLGAMSGKPDADTERECAQAAAGVSRLWDGQFDFSEVIRQVQYGDAEGVEVTTGSKFYDNWTVVYEMHSYRKGKGVAKPSKR